MEAVFPSSGRSPGGSGDSRSLEVASVEIAGLGEGWNLSTRGLGNRDTGFCVWSLVGRWGGWEEWDVTPFCMCRL